MQAEEYVEPLHGTNGVVVGWVVKSKLFDWPAATYIGQHRYDEALQHAYLIIREESIENWKKSNGIP